MDGDVQAVPAAGSGGFTVVSTKRKERNRNHLLSNPDSLALIILINLYFFRE